MCRIAAYQGPAIPLKNIIVRPPSHSLMTQSMHAAEAKLAVNGDGFGIAWYANGDPMPGLYHDVLQDDLYAARRSTTDSELLFLTMPANGLDGDPLAAIAATLDAIGEAGADGPVRLTCVMSDGVSLYAFRHASDGCCPSLCLSGTLDNGGRSIASEPLNGINANWIPVVTNSLLVLTGGEDSITRFSAFYRAA